MSQAPLPKRLKNGDWKFSDCPEFTPNLSPREIFQRGSFGGAYWRSITSAVTCRTYPNNQHIEFKEWWAGIDDARLNAPVADVSVNKYGVHSGSSLAEWERVRSDGTRWIHKQDPYGWVQWYCRFFKGRRTPDDARQIQRWKNYAGPRGRFRRRLVNMVRDQHGAKAALKHADASISPVIRQGLQHWGFVLRAHHCR